MTDSARILGVNFVCSLIVQWVCIQNPAVLMTSTADNSGGFVYKRSDGVFVLTAVAVVLKIN